MPRSPAEVTDTELSILNVLWDHGASEIRDIVFELYGEHTAALHATVKSLLERLSDKNLVSCDRSRFAHRFSAVLSREAFVGQQLQKLADSHFDGAVAPMVLALVEHTELTPRDRVAIRRIIDSLRSK